MQAIKGFMEFINESRRLMQLGLVRLNEEQKEFLDECTIGSWEFDPETGLVNIDSSFDCSWMNSTDFKGIRFGTVSGSFDCSVNQLTSLKGAPQEVGGDFSCSHNQLTSLEHAPQLVRGWFACSENQLTSLEGAPEYVDGDFSCVNNQLTSLEGAPTYVGGRFRCHNNPDLQSLAGLPKLHDVYVPDHLKERLKLMREEAKKLESEE